MKRFTVQIQSEINKIRRSPDPVQSKPSPIPISGVNTLSATSAQFATAKTSGCANLSSNTSSRSQKIRDERTVIFCDSRSSTKCLKPSASPTTVQTFLKMWSASPNEIQKFLKTKPFVPKMPHFFSIKSVQILSWSWFREAIHNLNPIQIYPNSS